MQHLPGHSQPTSISSPIKKLIHDRTLEAFYFLVNEDSSLPFPEVPLFYIVFESLNS